MNSLQHGVLSGFPLSSHQRRVWLQRQGRGVACSQGVFSIEGAVDARLVKAAVQRIIARHDILRTTFHLLEGVKMPLQVVTPDSSFTWQQVSIDGLAALEGILTDERRREFDLENGPNLRILFLTLHHQLSFLVITLPTLCADLGTLNNMVREFTGDYAAEHSQASDDGPVQYAQFSEWHHSLLEDDEDAASGREYWGQLARQAAHVDLRFPFEAVASRLRQPLEIFRFDLEPATVSRINSVSLESGVSSEAVFFASWVVLLSRLAAQSTYASWVSLSGRDHEMLYGVYGPLATPVPVLLNFESSSNFDDTLAHIHKVLIEAADRHTYYRPDQFEDQACSGIRFGFEFDQVETAHGADGICFSTLHSFHCPEDIDLKLAVSSRKKDAAEKSGKASFSAQIYYNPARFSAEFVRDLALHLRAFLIHLHGKKTLDEIEIQSEDQSRQLIARMNRASTGRDIEMTLHEVFENQAALTPGHPAVVYEGQSVSFSELNARANRVANHLRRLGVKNEDRVAICLERSPEIMVAILGILKAGGAYVPLDSTYPAQRLHYILDESQSKVVLTQRSFASVISPGQSQVVCLDDDQEIANAGDESPRVKVHPGNLAYIIYTSGSTGRPKGVMVQHRSVINLLNGLQQAIYKWQEQPLRIAINAPIVFDGSVKQWIQLLKGNTLCIIPEDKRLNPEALLAYIKDKDIHVLDCTPSQFKLLQANAASKQLDQLKAVLLGGEALDEQIWKTLQNQRTGFYNVYGPTECTVDVTACHASESSQPAIGRPLNNVQAYVLDNHLRPVPMGAAGELYAGGDGIARGYCGRPDLTAERFIPDPFNGSPGSRLYRTGDLACYLPDGKLKFLGRADEQVKVRGYRIELGEIASVVRELEGVRDALVLVRGEEKNDPRLIAYVVREAGAALSGAQLRQHVRSQLPDYMVPFAFVVLDQLPLTVNGKVDRKSLPDPDREHSDAQAEYVAPRSETERTITAIWQELLNVKKLGIHDNFFDLGGHSLLMVQLYNKLREAFHKEVPMVELFRNPTIAMLSQYFSGDSPEAHTLKKAHTRASRRLAAVRGDN